MGFRYHWLELTHIEADWPFDEAMRQRMFFLGIHVERPMPKGARAITIELFYGRPDNLIPEGTEQPHESIGLNVILHWPTEELFGN